MNEEPNRCLSCGHTPRQLGDDLYACRCKWSIPSILAWNTRNPINVLQIVHDKLIELEADGLFNCEMKCGCLAANMPACELMNMTDCQPAYTAHGIWEGEYYEIYFYPTRKAANEAKAKTREQLEEEYRNEQD